MKYYLATSPLAALLSATTTLTTVEASRINLRGAQLLSDYDQVNDSKYKLRASNQDELSDIMPNIVVFMVDDLGWNQVGYHANPAGNNEIYTPTIDKHATSGIIMNRGYMMQWCAPSRAAFQTGTTHSFNQNVTNDQFAFDEDIGFYGGIPTHIETLPKALKRVAEKKGKKFSTSYAGKWGIGGTAWLNSPLGAGYDQARTFWGDSIDGCDGHVSESSVPGTEGSINRWVQGYFDQFQDRPTVPTEQCNLTDAVSFLSQEEKDIACKTQPRSPPEYIDTDLLHFTQDIIKNHDYDESPLFHMHATQGVHTPQRYPSYYDDHSVFEQPEYLKTGKEKPIPNNDDVRMMNANMMRYIDDLFDGVVQSIKDAGQWENTIVLFTSDNGGAVFPNGESNQNYPLRGSKKSFFDGGNRVAQFLTGGWIDKHTSNDRLSVSNTYTFSMDWAPTFVEMVGGDRQDMYQALTEQTKGKAAYGNAMWEYIRRSVENNNNSSQINKPRKVSHSGTVFFDVQEDQTLKYWNTAGQANMFIRKWTPTFPQQNEVIPDFSYVSSSPCRDEDGNPMDCCVTNVELDPEEDSPIMDANCAALQDEAEELFYFTGEECELYPNMCLSSLPTDRLIPNNYEQAAYSYWSYAAGSPFTNDNGQPVVPSPMKCICDEIDDDTLPSEVDAMFVTLYSPTKCIKKSNYEDIEFHKCYNNTQCYVDCSGGFYKVPSPENSLLNGFKYAGIDSNLMRDIAHQEYTQGAGAVNVPDIYLAQQQYLRRVGFTRWSDK